MKRIFIPALLGGALALGTLAADKPEAGRPVPTAREDAFAVTVKASVEAVDLATREVTLKGPLGNVVTLTVDPAVKRLNEIKVGDFVRADYYLSVAAELRKPTPEEEQNPITVLEGAAKAPPGASPAARGLRRLKVVATIEGLDRSTQTVTVKGPLGNHLTARVADPAVLGRLQLGEKVVLTVTEALAISLEKVPPVNLP